MICELLNVGYYGNEEILHNDVDILNIIQGERMLSRVLELHFRRDWSRWKAKT